MVTTLPTNQRFFKNVKEWRVGRSAATHTYLIASSGFIGCEWEEVDPYVKLEIPGAANSVYQIIRPPDVVGRITCRDYEGVWQLLYNTNIDASANKAVTATTRNVIDYFAIQIDMENVVAATGVPSMSTAVYTFANTRIGRIHKQWNDPAGPWIVEFYADSWAPV